MNKLTGLKQPGFSAFTTLSFVAIMLLALACTAPVMAHGPGLEGVDKITAQLAESGEQAALYAKRARIFQNNHMWQEAMADFDKAAQLDTLEASYDLDRAALSFEADEYLRALDFINLYLLRHANNTQAALIQARSLRALGQYQASVESYQVALDNLPGFDGRPHPEWYIEFAETYLLADDKSNALRIIQLGIDRLGLLSVYQLKAAELEVDLGLYDSALGRIDQLLAQAQRKDIWLARRADILSRAGRDDEARQTYEQAYAALKALPLRLRSKPVSRELEASLQQQFISQ